LGSRSLFFDDLARKKLRDKEICKILKKVFGKIHEIVLPLQPEK
jgi:hypothetical protein